MTCPKCGVDTPYKFWCWDCIKGPGWRPHVPAPFERAPIDFDTPLPGGPVSPELPSSATEHDLADGRMLCVWCAGPTARLGKDRRPRHGWCEPYSMRPPIWTRSSMSPSSRVTPALPDEGSQAPAKTWARPRRKPAQPKGKQGRRKKAA